MSILTEAKVSLIKQYIALMAIDGVVGEFTDNASPENIGMRRRQTMMEHALNEISYSASDHNGTSATIDVAYLQKNVSNLSENTDLSRFVL